MSFDVEKFNILFVDDDKIQIKMYLDSIEVIQEEFPDIEFKPTIMHTFESGMSALYQSYFDAAIIDLKLSNDGSNEGNKIIREIKGNLRFPVVVYSGFPQDLDPDLGEDNCLFKRYKRTDKLFKDILLELITLHRTGITRVFGKKGLIDESLNKIFWNHIASTASNWIGDSTSDMEKIVLRYTMSHLHEYLELDEKGNFEIYHNSEVYIMPPIKTSPFTGDVLLSKEGKHFIILTPACDFAQGKAKQVAIAEIENLDMEQVKIAQSKLKSKDAEKNKIGKIIIEGLISNKSSARFHFLPPSHCFQGGFINFQKIQSIEYVQIIEDYTRMMSVSGRFVKDIISHFSHYYARQGQPDLNFEKLYKIMVNL